MSFLRSSLHGTTQRRNSKEENEPVYFSFTRYSSSLCDAPLLLPVSFIVMNCPKLYRAVSAITLMSDASRISHPTRSRALDRGVGIGTAETAPVLRRLARRCISSRSEGSCSDVLPPLSWGQC